MGQKSQGKVRSKLIKKITSIAMLAMVSSAFSGKEASANYESQLAICRETHNVDLLHPCNATCLKLESLKKNHSRDQSEAIQQTLLKLEMDLHRCQFSQSSHEFLSKKENSGIANRKVKFFTPYGDTTGLYKCDQIWTDKPCKLKN